MILVLSDLWVPFPGGAERLMFNLARDLMRRGEDVAVVTGYHPAKQFDGPRVMSVVVPAGDERAHGVERLKTLIYELAPDLILTHHYWAFEFERELVATGIPIVQIVLNGHRIPEAAMAIFISQYVLNQTCTAEAPPRHNDMVITPPAFPDVIASRHGDAIGFIKPIHHKGVDLVYDIARALPDRQFVILRGEWQDIETIVELPNVEFMEPVDDIRDFYARCRLVLMPSLSEDAGTVAQECTLNGIPCISSSVGGLDETNFAGVRLHGRDPAMWAEAIQLLDSPARYMDVVLRQGLSNPTHQIELLELFHDRIRAILAGTFQ